MDATTVRLERRRHPRTLVRMTLGCIRLDPDGGEVLDSLRMLDISRSGMGAATDRRFYPGQRLVLCLPVTASRGRRNVYATVRRCSAAGNAYRVGLEFDKASVGSSYAAGPAALAAA
jgi:hypothetical protein